MKYLAVCQIEATPVTAGEFAALTGIRPVSIDGEIVTDNFPGYHVVQGSHRPVFMGKFDFEKFCFPMENSDGNAVSHRMVDEFTGQVKSSKLDAKTTLVSAETMSGFALHHVSSCVDPAKYNHEIGTEIGTNRIKDDLWKCLGFVLQWAKYGLKVN